MVDASIISTTSVKDSLIAMVETLPSSYSIGLILLHSNSFTIYNLHSSVPHSFTVSTDNVAMVGLEELFPEKSPFISIESCKASFISSVDSLDDRNFTSQDIVFGKVLDALLNYLHDYESRNFGNEFE